MKKVFSLFLTIFLLITFCSVVQSDDAKEPCVYLSSSGNDETGDGSKEKPFATVPACYRALPDGGTVIVTDEISEVFKYDSLSDITCRGSIRFTGTDIKDGKIYKNARLHYLSPMLITDTTFDNITLETSEDYSFLNSLGHKLTIEDTVKIVGKGYIHFGSYEKSLPKVSDDSVLTVAGGSYSDVYIGGAYQFDPDDGMYGDQNIILRNCHINSLLIGFDSYLPEHVPAVIKGDLFIDIGNGVDIWNLYSVKLKDNRVVGAITCLINGGIVNSLDLPDATEGVYVINVSDGKSGDVSLTEKPGVINIKCPRGKVAMIADENGERLADDGNMSLAKGTTTVSFVKKTRMMNVRLASDGAYVNGYPDGRFLPDGLITRAEAVSLVSRLAVFDGEIEAEPAPFTDIKDSDWFYNDVARLSATGALPYGWKETLSPSSAITRGEFAELVYALSARNTADRFLIDFPDVTPDDDCYNAVTELSGTGAIVGFPDGNFYPARTLTRAEAVTVLNRLMDRAAIDGGSGFSDTVGHWAASEITAALSVPSGNRPVKSFALPEKTAGSVYGANVYVPALINEAPSLSAHEVRRGVDAISEQMKKDILGSKDELVVTGTRYYVSNDGDDANDGKSPEHPWRTIGKMAGAPLSYGDAVLFRRGDTFRGTFTAQYGVSYGAYGEGEKPVIMQSSRNYAAEELWEKTEWEDVWVCKNSLFNVGIVAFDHDIHDHSENTYSEIVGIMQNARLFDFMTPADLHEDLEFYSDLRENKLYLVSKKGNPGKRFSDIEIGERYNIVDGSASNVTLDNLSFKFTGAHAMGAGTCRDRTVTNCVFSWLGGSILSESYGATGLPVNYGNAVEIYGGCNGYFVSNNWMYQIYDTAVTHQYSVRDACTQENIRYYGNLMEYCHWGIEVYNMSNDPHNIEKNSSSKYTRNVRASYNLIREGGYGWGSIQRHRQTQAWDYHINSISDNYDEITEYNIFDRCAGKLMDTHFNCTETDRNNLLIQTEDLALGYFRGVYAAADPSCLEILKNDGQTGNVVILTKDL